MVSNNHSETASVVIARPDVLRDHKPFLSPTTVHKELAVLNDVFKAKSEEQDPGRKASKYARPSVEDDVLTGEEFINHNGTTMTQEQIDADEGDDAEMADDTEQRQEAEQGDTEREKFLKQGATNIVDLLKNPAKVPRSVAELTQSSCKTFRLAWLDGPRKTDTTHLQQINKTLADTLESSNNRKTCTLDWDNILHTIYSIHDSMLWWFDDQEPFRRTDAGKSCALLALSLVKLLDPCGLDWKSVVPAELRKTINRILLSSMSTLPKEVQAMLISLADREKVATRLQEMTVQPAMSHVARFFDACKNSDVDTMAKELEKIAPINETLKEMNANAGFRPEDRLLPIAILASCVKSAKTVHEPSKMVALAERSKAYFGKILRDACGYRNLGAQLIDGPEEKLLGAKWIEKADKTIEVYQANYQEPVQAILRRSEGSRSPLITSKSAFAEVPRTASVLESAKYLKTPVDSTFSLPSMKDGRTEFGILISIQPLPRGAFRTTVNAGTEKYPLLVSVPGSDFGRGTIEDVSKNLKHLYAKKLIPVNQRRRAHIKEIYDIVTIPRSSTESKRTGVVKFCIRYHEDPAINPLANEEPLEEVRSRSECIIILGKMTVDRQEARLIKLREVRMLYILASIQRGLNPDTRRDADQKAMADMPWLYSMSAFNMGSWYISRLGYEYSLLGMPVARNLTERTPWYLGNNQAGSYLSNANGLGAVPNDGLQFARASTDFSSPFKQDRVAKAISHVVASPGSQAFHFEDDGSNSLHSLMEDMDLSNDKKKRAGGH